MARTSPPLRTCVGCRRVVPAGELVRHVVVAGVLQRDPSGTAPGRGAWLHPDAECTRLALRRAAFSRSFRTKVDDSALTGDLTPPQV